MRERVERRLSISLTSGPDDGNDSRITRVLLVQLAHTGGEMSLTSRRSIFFFQFFSAEESRRSENLMTSFNERLVIHHAQSVIRDRSATDYLPLFVAIVVVVVVVTIH